MTDRIAQQIADKLYATEPDPWSDDERSAQARREAEHLAAIEAGTHDCDSDPRCNY